MPAAVNFHKISLYQTRKVDKGKDHRQQYYRSDHTGRIEYLCLDQDQYDKEDKQGGGQQELCLFYQHKKDSADQACRYGIEERGDGKLCLSLQQCLDDIGMDLYSVHLTVVAHRGGIGILHTHRISPCQYNGILKDTGIHSSVQHIRHGYKVITAGFSGVGEIETVVPAVCFRKHCLFPLSFQIFFICLIGQAVHRFTVVVDIRHSLAHASVCINRSIGKAAGDAFTQSLIGCDHILDMIGVVYHCPVCLCLRLFFE